MIQLTSYAFKTSPGPVLKSNEDLVEINLVNNIFMVFDGFGGVGIGDLAVNYVRDKILEFYTSASSDPDATLPYFFDPKYKLELNVLMNAIHHVHKEFMKDNMDRPVSLRAGMSLLIGLYVDNLFMTVSLGNCMALLRRGGKLTRMTIPDTLVDSALSGSDVALSLYPSNAFGLYNKLQLNISELKVVDGDQVILCSDGIYAYQTNEELNYVLSKNFLSNSERIKEVMELSNLRGNWDNQSLILLNF